MFDRSSVDIKCDKDMNKRRQDVVSSNELIYTTIVTHIFSEKLKNSAIHQNHNYQDICEQLLILEDQDI